MQSSHWSQITPQYMPWGHTPACPAAPLVTFTAEPQSLPQHQQHHRPGPSGLCYKQTLAPHCKRKAELELLVSSAKQHVTEERMAAHMSRLHISSESPPEPSTDNTASAVEEVARSRQQRLYVCEEMRRLQTESILPAALLGRIERPCMAVMLWQPPPRLPELLPPDMALGCTVSTGPTRLLTTDDDSTDNNNSSTLDLNQMDMDT